MSHAGVPYISTLNKRLVEAVYDCNLNLLKQLHDENDNKQFYEAVNTKLVSGQSLLLFAAELDHCEIVDYLVRECQANPEDVGRVEIDNENIDDASALWCSAAVGCFQCVKVLLEHGANVNTTTSTNSTPLRAACFDGHLEIVKYLVENNANIELANQHGHTCLMIACYKKHYEIAEFLILKGAQVNRQSLKGNTALHDCVDSKGSAHMIDLLLDHGAKLLKDYYGLTPLMAAALAGNNEIVDYFVHNVFVSRKLGTLDEIEDAYRLLGATLVDKENDIVAALQYWAMALNFRDDERQSFKDMQDFGDDEFQRQFYLTGFDESFEFETPEQFEKLKNDPSAVYMQSQLIRLRVIGVHHPDTSYFVRARGAILVYSNRNSQCLSLWMYVLKQQHDLCPPLSLVTQNSYVSLIELITHLSREENNSAELTTCDIFRIWQLASKELLMASIPQNTQNGNRVNGNRQALQPQYKNDADTLNHVRMEISFDGDYHAVDRQFLICLQLIGFMCQKKNQMCSKLWLQFRRSVFEFLRHQPRSTCSSTVLHIICFLRWRDLWQPPTYRWIFDIFALVVELSPDLNVVDAAGNTALHLLFQNRHYKSAYIKHLLGQGAHLDVCNQAGRTPLDILGEAEPQWNQTEFITLQCLTAQKIAKMLTPKSSKDREKALETLPVAYKDFIKLHLPRSLVVEPNEDNL